MFIILIIARQLPHEYSVASLPGHEAVLSAPVHSGLASSQRSASNELKHLFHYNQCNKSKSSTKACGAKKKKN